MCRQLFLLLAFSSSARVSGNTLRGHHYTAKPDKLGVETSHTNIRHSGSTRRLSTSLIATEDATIRSSTPYTNYGTDDTLSFISPPTSDDKVETLLKFDLPTTTPPSSTYLHLFTTSECNFSTSPIAPNLGLISISVADNVVDSNAVGSTERWEWNEESVNWYNSPMVNGEKIVKSLGDLEGGAWVEIEITNLLTNLQIPTLTLRLSSVLFANSDDKLSLCTFRSKDYREGILAPRLAFGPHDLEVVTEDVGNADESEPVVEEEKQVKQLSNSLVEGIQVQEEEPQSYLVPHKLFPPKIDFSATTTKLTACAPPYDASLTYAHGQIVSSGEKNYKCKPYPYTSWCSSDKYEPGKSDYWSLAWDLVNDCKSTVQSIHQKDSDKDTSFKEPTVIAYSVHNADDIPSSSILSPLCPGSWNFVYPYKTGDRVTLPSTMTIYECKEEPFGHYCADEAYEVGLEGGVFENAWKAVGKCVNGRVVEDDEASGFVQALSPTTVDLAVPEAFQKPIGCNLCRPGQIGINADIPIDGKVTKCIEIYDYYLKNHLEGTQQCISAQNWLNGICCGDKSLMNTGAVADSAASSSVIATAAATATTTTDATTTFFVTADPTDSPTNKPVTLSPVAPEPTTASPVVFSQAEDTMVGAPPALPPNNVEEVAEVPCATAFDNSADSYSLNDRVSKTGGNYKCMMQTWCHMPDFEPQVGQYWMVVWEYEGPCGSEDPSSSFAETTQTELPSNNIVLSGFTDETPAPSTNPIVTITSEPTKEPNPAPTPLPTPDPTDTVTIEPVVTVPRTPNPTDLNIVTEPPFGPTELIADESEVSGFESNEPLTTPAASAESLLTVIEPECPDAWILDAVYAEGDKVGAQGQAYTCKGFPYTGWCGLASYEPAVGEFWDMAWDLGENCEGQGTRPPTPMPSTSTPTTARPTRDPSTPASEIEEGSGDDSAPATDTVPITKDMATGEKVFTILEGKKDAIDNELFLYQGSEPSSVYRYDGFVAGLRVMFESGVAGKFFYLGDDSEDGYKYGLANLAAFIGQSIKETIQYDACDENSWDLVDGKYPLSNACGQLGQNYQEYHCSEEEKHMECPVDPNMSIKGVTHAKWYGAPGPLFCGPKSEYEFTGFWDYGYCCNNVWADPPEYCEDYEDQKAGRYDNTSPVANVAGRTDVEGCCWWGRGVIQTTGVCNFGKLNYFLGARAAEEGRDARYPEIDFCKDPEVICASQEHQELKWIAGMFYWVESLQSYNERGWDYTTELHKFVDGGMSDISFINGVSGVVNRGCHDPPCGTGDVDGAHERAGNFEKVLSTFLA